MDFSSDLLDLLKWYSVLKSNIVRVVQTMNFFIKESSLSQMANAESMSTKASRIYAVLLGLSVLTIIVSKGLDQTIVFETMSFPSLAAYEQLQAKYPNTLSCTCQQIFIFHRSFVTITPKIHQVSYFMRTSY